MLFRSLPNRNKLWRVRITGMGKPLFYNVEMPSHRPHSRPHAPSVSFWDPMLTLADSALRTMFASHHAQRPYPGQVEGQALNDAERQLSASLMRVNHVGEVCAQALYTAQAQATRNPALKRHFAHASQEELLEVAKTHIHERPAVPKEIIVLDQLPLTAVGKPQKHLLQLDAARRTFQDVFKEVKGDWTMDVEISGGGLMLKMGVPAEQENCRKEIEQILSGFAIRHEVSTI